MVNDSLRDKAGFLRESIGENTALLNASLRQSQNLHFLTNEKLPRFVQRAMVCGCSTYPVQRLSMVTIVSNRFGVPVDICDGDLRAISPFRSKDAQLGTRHVFKLRHCKQMLQSIDLWKNQ